MTFSPSPTTLPRSLTEARETLGQRPRRKVANNTYLEPRNGSIAIRLHDTDIVRFHLNDLTTFDTGGWLTMLTKSRINDALPEGIVLSSDRGRWYFYDRTGLAERIPFTDGITLNTETFEVYSGGIDSATVKAEDSENTKMRKAVNKYLRDTTPAEIVRAFENPGGDCWFCSRAVPITDMDGNPSVNVEHLRSHVDEHYVMYSLALNAVQARGFTNADVIMGIIYHSAKAGRVDSLYTDSLRRYLRKALKVGAVAVGVH